MGIATAILTKGLVSAEVQASILDAALAPSTSNQKEHSMQTTINGATINYEMVGAENQHPMIVLHGGRGFGTYPGVFKAYKPLANHYRLIGYDMRGHGYSSLTPPYTFDQLVDDLEEIRKTLGGNQKMVLLGGSFGGMIALSYAVKYPDGLSHLVLRGTAPSWHHEREAMDNFRERAARKAPMATEGMLEKIFSTIADDNEFRLIMYSLYPMYVEDGQPINHDAILETARRGIYHANVHNDLFANHDYDVVDRLPSIKVPTMVMCGDSDWICPPSQSRLIASKIPGSKLVVVPNSNHGVPDDIALRDVSTFLAERS
jgi:proline iminopeptidase